MKSGKWYAFWSGFGADFAEGAIFISIVGLYHRHKCQNCWRPAFEGWTRKSSGERTTKHATNTRTRMTTKRCKKSTAFEAPSDARAPEQGASMIATTFVERWVWPAGGSGGIPGDVVATLIWVILAVIASSILYPPFAERVRKVRETSSPSGDRRTTRQTRSHH